MDNTSISKLLDLRKQLADYKLLVDKLKEEKQTLETSLLEQLRAEEVLSKRFEDFTITRAKRKTLKVIDLPKVVAWLKKNKMKNLVKETVGDEFKYFADECIKQQKTVVGTEINETEYISIRSK